MSPLSLCLFTIFLLISVISAHDDLSHKCIHSQISIEPELLDIPSYNEDFQGRALQAYENIRIFFDFSALSNLSTTTQDYIKNVIVPPAENYFEAALKVVPMTENITTPLPTTCGGAVILPPIYSNEGVAADLVIFVDTVQDATQAFVAYVLPCAVNTVNKRPMLARLVYNTAKVIPTTNNMQIERDITVTLHETTHTLGFSSTLFKFFIDPVTNLPLTGHLFTKIVNGQNISVINVAPLTTRLRKYFNCSTLEGAYLENEGGTGSAGFHFERRILYNDYMTASTLKDVRVTEFSLALLEGSGWYQIDYSMAEPITWGKDKGCAFLQTPCMDTVSKRPRFEEFCGPLGKMGCSWTNRGLAVCGTSLMRITSQLSGTMNYWNNNTVINDQFSDNCPIFDIYSNFDCEDEGNQGKATLSGEFYGVGGKCFMGTLYPRQQLTAAYGYCFKTKCVARANQRYTLQVQIGNTTVSCVDTSSISVPGFQGRLYCPDPNKFCAKEDSEGFCRRRCSGRGTCVNKVCKCADGWAHHDCSRKIYTNNCAKCAGKDSFKTSCYGDSCECNPANRTCMAASQLNLKVVANQIQNSLVTKRVASNSPDV